VFGDQEAVGGDAECGVMVEAAPPAPFIITKAEFLFELLVVTLDPPIATAPDRAAATLRNWDETIESGRKESGS
jgi:hypothetical protein